MGKTRSFPRKFSCLLVMVTFFCPLDTATPYEVTCAGSMVSLERCEYTESLLTNMDLLQVKMNDTRASDIINVTDGIKRSSFGWSRSSTRGGLNVNVLEVGEEGQLPGASPSRADLFSVLFFPAGVGVGLTLCCTLLSTYTVVDGASRAQLVVAHMYVASFFGGFTFTVFVPDSYDLTVLTGRDASESGLLVGSFFGISLCGVFAMYYVSTRYLSLWWNGARAVQQLTTLLYILGAVLQITCAFDMAYGDTSTRYTSSIRWGLLLNSRLLTGFANGFASQFIWTSFPQLLCKEQVANVSANMMAFIMVGLGLGPPMASLSQMADLVIHHQPGRQDLLVAVPVMCLAAVLTELIVLTFSCPCLTEEPLKAQTQEIHVSKEFSGQRLLLLACIFAGALHRYVISGVEVATSLLLETKFHWARSPTGYVIGATFLMCIPVKLIFDTIAHMFSKPSRIRIMYLITLLGIVCLFRAEAASIILGDMLVFPFCYQADSMVQGFLTQFALPKGNRLDINNCLLLMNIASFGSRFAGPYLARSVIQHYSQTIYAASFLGTVAITVAMFEAFISFKAS